MVLENRFGLVLSDVGVALHEPVTRFYRKEAGELKLGTTVVEGVERTDNSLLSGLFLTRSMSLKKNTLRVILLMMCSKK